MAQNTQDIRHVSRFNPRRFAVAHSSMPTLALLGGHVFDARHHGPPLAERVPDRRESVTGDEGLRGSRTVAPAFSALRDDAVDVLAVQREGVGGDVDAGVGAAIP